MPWKVSADYGRLEDPYTRELEERWAEERDRQANALSRLNLRPGQTVRAPGGQTFEVVALLDDELVLLEDRALGAGHLQTMAAHQLRRLD